MTASRPVKAGDAGSDLGRALNACRRSFLSAGFFSLFVNLLLLVPALYMLQIYDRVLASGSQSTLAMLTLIVVFLFLAMGGLEWVRSQILVVTGTRIDRLLGARVFDSVFNQALLSGGRTASAQPLGDLLQVRQFVTGPGLFAFFDAPWLPIYVVVMFMFHPLFGVMAVLAAAILAGLAIWNEVSTREDLKEANRLGVESSLQTQRNLRNVEVIEAMGMLPRIRERWQDKQDFLLGLQARASRKAGLIAAASRTFRITVQSFALGLGAYLAIRKEITPGVVIAGSILLGRALAPIDQMIASWRGFVAARDAYQRLDELLQATPEKPLPLRLPIPTGEITIDKLVIVPPGAAAPVIKGVSAKIDRGMLLAVIGPSAAGKSTLLRALLGLHRPQSGTVRLDGAELDQWERSALGQHLGYLPQDVELLDGTVSENIARFGTVDPDNVVSAARAAGVHEMILKLPDGYETRIQGNAVSAGQRQRIGIARALYGDPQIVVLDEPNSNLDQDGDSALIATLSDLHRGGRTVVVVTHRSNILAVAEKVLVLADGQVAMFGDRDKVLAALQEAQRSVKLTSAAPAVRSLAGPAQ